MTDLHQQIQDRLEELRRELKIGEDRLRALEQESLAVQQTTLRISGAIQVLTELLQTAPPASDGAGPPSPVPEAEATSR